MTDLVGTPYSLAEDSSAFRDMYVIQEHVDLLRSRGALRSETLKAHFGNTRFEQIAESNAIEGSTLSVNETQLAVLSGITISGHDPAYVRDARNLSAALHRIVELAKSPKPTSLEQLQEVHLLILGDRPGAGVFRREPIRISGSDHRPPKTWAEIMSAMEDWEEWSTRNPSAPTLLRATVLHTWLTHVHPFLDGNGRTARAIINLELIRHGYPSVIIRRKDRLRYYEALAESDAGGDLSSIGELVAQRARDSIEALERVAKAEEGYDVIRARMRAEIDKHVSIWNDAVKLLFSLVQEALQRSYGGIAQVSTQWYESDLSVDDYLALQNNDATGNTWSFNLSVAVPGIGDITYLAWIGFRSFEMRRRLNDAPGPSIFWSRRQDGGPHRWTRCDEVAPGGAELTVNVPNVDRWAVRSHDGLVHQMLPSELASAIVADIDRRLRSA